MPSSFSHIAAVMSLRHKAKWCCRVSIISWIQESAALVNSLNYRYRFEGHQHMKRMHVTVGSGLKKMTCPERAGGEECRGHGSFSDI